MDDTARCPCLSGDVYGDCCGPLHAGAAAPTAERLMRSRYTAYVLRDVAYLAATWHPSTRPAGLDVDPGTRWFRLDIVRTESGGPFDDAGVVEFEARSTTDGEVHVQHEASRFVRDRDRRWLYVDGLVS
jgi:SEC-C motif-containing protein